MATQASSRERRARGRAHLCWNGRSACPGTISCGGGDDGDDGGPFLCGGGGGPWR